MERLRLNIDIVYEHKEEDVGQRRRLGWIGRVPFTFTAAQDQLRSQTQNKDLLHRRTERAGYMCRLHALNGQKAKIEKDYII